MYSAETEPIAFEVAPVSTQKYMLVLAVKLIDPSCE
jgi:hypothetical protein